MPQTTELTLSAPMRAAVDICLHCYAICEETKVYCLRTGGRHIDPEHLATMADCARMCETSANFMVRNSEMHGEVCRLCADACERCARSCEQVDRDDEVMRRCAAECRRGAESCRQMAA